MKYTLTNVKSVNRSGKSKSTGEPYHIDMTVLTVSLPVNKPDQFGTISKEYNYGDHRAITNLESLRDKLPLEVELELVDQIDKYDNLKTVVRSVNHPLLKTPIK